LIQNQAALNPLLQGVLGFLGFKKKQDVEDFLKKEYGEEFKRQLAKAVGDDEQLVYLNKSVARENRIYYGQLCI